jgi:hypothetical protein
MEIYFAGLSSSRPTPKRKYFYWGASNSRLSALYHPFEEGNIANLRNVMILINFAKN